MTRGRRLLSGVEVLVGSAIVIGHNVYHVVPNEVPILFLLGLASTRIREGAWSAIGFRRPKSWGRILAIAVVAAGLRIALGDLVVGPIASRFWPHIVSPHGANDVQGNPLNALIALVIVWGFAAFGEEIGYRGYLLRRAADAAGGSQTAQWAAVFLVSVLFGIGHWYKGPAGVVDSGVAGLILGIAYLVSGRNLWACVLAHGLIDTVAVVSMYLGLTS